MQTTDKSQPAIRDRLLMTRDFNRALVYIQFAMKKRTASEIIRWGIIGCGDVTEVKSGPAFQKAPGSALVSVMRRNGDKANDYAQRHGVPKWTTNARELIEDNDVDIVYVATPPSSHMDYALLCAEAGKPVYVEKPMAANFAECKRMIDACEKAGVPLFVAYYRRALPRFLKIKQLIDSGEIGEVRSVTMTLHSPPDPTDLHADSRTWRVKPEISGGGRFVDLASHTLDIFDFLLGPVKRVTGFAANQGRLYPAEDTVWGGFEFASGVAGTGNWCFVASMDADRNQIIGSKGTLVFSTFGDSAVVLQSQCGTQEFAIENPTHIQQPLIETILAELCGQGVCPSKGVSASRASWVMDAFLKEYYSTSREA